jgi:putative FmdB family regulatory protein
VSILAAKGDVGIEELLPAPRPGEHLDGRAVRLLLSGRDDPVPDALKVFDPHRLMVHCAQASRRRRALGRRRWPHDVKNDSSRVEAEAMPTYAYRCEQCEETFERSETISEHVMAKPQCPKCRSDKVARVPTPFTAVTGKKS